MGAEWQRGSSWEHLEADPGSGAHLSSRPGLAVGAWDRVIPCGGQPACALVRCVLVAASLDSTHYKEMVIYRSINNIYIIGFFLTERKGGIES